MKTVSDEPEDAIPFGDEAFVIDHIAHIKQKLLMILPNWSISRTNSPRVKLVCKFPGVFSHAPVPAGFCTF